MGTELMSIYPRDNRDLRQEYKIIDRTVRASSVAEEGCFRKSTARRQRRKISIVMATDVRNIAPLVADSRQEKSRRHLSDHCDMCPEVSIRLLGIVVVLAAMDDPVAGVLGCPKTRLVYVPKRDTPAFCN